MPDCRGSYIRGEDYDGYPTYTREDDAWSIWYYEGFGNHVISAVIGVPLNEEIVWWDKTLGGIYAEGTYYPGDITTGQPIFTLD